MNAVTDGAIRVVSNPETEGWNRADNFRVARHSGMIAKSENQRGTLRTECRSMRIPGALDIYRRYRHTDMGALYVPGAHAAAVSSWLLCGAVRLGRILRCLL